MPTLAACGRGRSKDGGDVRTKRAGGGRSVQICGGRLSLCGSLGAQGESSSGSCGGGGGVVSAARCGAVQCLGLQRQGCEADVAGCSGGSFLRPPGRVGGGAGHGGGRAGHVAVGNNAGTRRARMMTSPPAQSQRSNAGGPLGRMAGAGGGTWQRGTALECGRPA